MSGPNFNSLILLFLTLLLAGCGTQESRSTEPAADSVAGANSSAFNIRLITSGEGWGYQITQNESLIINQPMIPAVSGNHPFITKDEAQRVGELVVKKLNQGKRPPSVTLHELDSLEITY